MSLESLSPSGQFVGRRSFIAARIALQRLLEDECGQDMIEYALVATLIGLSTLVGVHGAANTIVNMILQVGTNFANDV